MIVSHRGDWSYTTNRAFGWVGLSGFWGNGNSENSRPGQKVCQPLNLITGKRSAQAEGSGVKERNAVALTTPAKGRCSMLNRRAATGAPQTSGSTGAAYV